MRCNVGNGIEPIPPTNLNLPTTQPPLLYGTAVLAWYEHHHYTTIVSGAVRPFHLEVGVVWAVLEAERAAVLEVRPELR